MFKSGSDKSYQFLRNGSIHDLRNLLQTVSSGISVAESRIEDGRSGEVPAILAKIGDSVEKASALLRQMVRIPRSSLTFKSAVDIGKMFATLEASLRWALGPCNELVIAIAPDLPPLYCVENEFENVILNLVINARDAMPNARPRGHRSYPRHEVGPRRRNNPSHSRHGHGNGSRSRGEGLRTLFHHEGRLRRNRTGPRHGRSLHSIARRLGADRTDLDKRHDHGRFYLPTSACLSRQRMCDNGSPAAACGGSAVAVSLERTWP